MYKSAFCGLLLAMSVIPAVITQEFSADLTLALIKLLDKSCVATFLIGRNLNRISKLLISFQERDNSSGLLLLDKSDLPLWKLNLARSSWPCFDIVTLDKFDVFFKSEFPISNNVFETRSSRHIFANPSLENKTIGTFVAQASLEGQLKQAVAYLSHSHVTDLRLVCRALKKGSLVTSKRIDKFSHKRGDWILGHSERKSFYKLCSNDRYYHGRDFTYTGTGDFGGVTAIPGNLAKLMAKQLGSTYKFKRTRGCQNIKDELPSKRTTLGKIYYKEADIGANIAVKYKINQYFDYIYYHYEDYFFVGQKPKRLAQYNNVFYPFGKTTWYFMFTSLMACVLVSILISSGQKNGQFLDTLFLFWGMMFQENHSKIFKRKPYSGVIIRMSWLFCTSLLIMAYQATLKASLTLTEYEDSVETHWDMLRRDVPIYTYMGSFRDSHAPYHSALREHVKRWNSQIGLRQTLQYLLQLFQGENAFMYSSTWQELTYESYYVSKFGREGYPLRRIKENFSYTHLVFCVKKFLPQTEIIKDMVGLLIASGIVDYEFRKYDLFHGMKQASIIKEEKIGSDHIVIILTVLILSFLVGTFTLMVEFQWKKVESRKSQSDKRRKRYQQISQTRLSVID